MSSPCAESLHRKIWFSEGLQQGCCLGRTPQSLLDSVPDSDNYPSDFRERSYHIGSIFKTHFNKAVVGLCLTQICTLSRWKQETRIQPSKSYLRTWFVYAFIPLMSWGKNSFVKKQMFRSIRITVGIVSNHWEWRNPNWLYRFSVPPSSPLLHMRTSLLNIFR